MNALSSLLNSPWTRQAVTSGSAGGAGDASGTSGTSGTASGGFLSSSNFFQLLTAQLSHQDPLSPMNSTKFMSELAQLSTANGMQSLGQTVASLQGSQSAAKRLRATGLIGHDVGVSGNGLTLPSGGSASGAFVLPSAAQNVQVAVTDGSGNVVDRIKLGAQGAGVHRFNWDGAGQPSGDYRFSVQAFDASGHPVSAKTLSLAKISSVAFSPSGDITLSFANRSGTMPFGQVSTIF